MFLLVRSYGVIDTAGVVGVKGKNDLLRFFLFEYAATAQRLFPLTPMETTQVRISKALNERLKTTLANARNRIPVGQAIERLLGEALDYAEGKAVSEQLAESLRAQLNIASTVSKATSAPSVPLADLESIIGKILDERGITQPAQPRKKKA